MLVNNKARDRSESNRHMNKNWMFLQHNFFCNIILKIDNSITLVVCDM